MPVEKNYTLAEFKSARESLVAKCNTADLVSRRFKIYEFSPDEINDIIKGSTLVSRQRLSESFFVRNSLYKRIIIYYATLLTYTGLLIPNPSFGTQLSEKNVSKRYSLALNYMDKLNWQEELTRISLHALIDGAYYGIIQTLTKDSCVLFDLPAQYCRSRFKDFSGNDVVEFNTEYFNTIIDENLRTETLKVYPKIVRNQYKRYMDGSASCSWVTLPTDIGVCFPIFDDCDPLFVSMIPTILQYEQVVDTETERAMDEIRKIIVQKIPHLNDGQLVFEPNEAVEIHEGTVGMLKGNPYISVLTTYADVDSIVSKTTADNVTSTLDKMLLNVYANAGVSPQIFAPTGTQALETSLENDTALMMVLGNKYSRFLSSILTQLFGNNKVTFDYKILPITYYNRSEYITDALKMAQYGYSFLIPALAAGLSQNELINLKSLENNVLELHSVLIPLQSSYTQSAEISEPGAPEKKPEEKSQRTLEDEASRESSGGLE